MSPPDGTTYIVFWWFATNTIARSVALTNDTKFIIEDLLSNTAYDIVVMAKGPLGNVNSTTKVLYTTASEIQGEFTEIV